MKKSPNKNSQISLECQEDKSVIGLSEQEKLDGWAINSDGGRVKRQRTEVWSRCMGYHRPVSHYNIGKKSISTLIDSLKSNNFQTIDHSALYIAQMRGYDKEKVFFTEEELHTIKNLLKDIIKEKKEDAPTHVLTALGTFGDDSVLDDLKDISSKVSGHKKTGGCSDKGY